MKRFAAFALVAALPPLAHAGNPVSVHPPAPPASLNQPLTAAVQSAAVTLPPAPVMSITPSWGSPALLPGTTVPSACGDGGCGATTPYFNVLAPRGLATCSSAAGCPGTVSGTFLDRFRDWIGYQPLPGGHGLTPTPYRAAARSYFSSRDNRCLSGGCAGGASNAPAAGGVAQAGCADGNCGVVPMTVTPLSGSDCTGPACRPRVLYQPLVSTAAAPARVGLFARLFGGGGRVPKKKKRWDPVFSDNWMAPRGTHQAADSLPTFQNTPATAPKLMTPPAGAPAADPPASVPLPAPMPTTPTVPPPGDKPKDKEREKEKEKDKEKTSLLSPFRPFTNP